MRNLFATPLLSRRTPMILAGDEFARTQQGNNNAYAQDNEISWTDWEGIDADGLALAEFVQKLILLRHALRMLRRDRCLTGAHDKELGFKNATWLTSAGDEMTREDWADINARCMGVLLDGRAQETGIHQVGTDATLLLVLNARYDIVPFTLPEAVDGSRWLCLIDTNQDNHDQMSAFDFGHDYEVAGRSVLLFMLEPIPSEATAETCRSFRHVVDAFQTAASEPVRLAPEA